MNVFILLGITFKGGLAVVVVKLLEEVLLTVERSNLCSEADLSSRVRKSVNRFRANTVVPRRNRYGVVAIHDSLAEAGSRNEEQTTISWIERKVCGAAKSTDCILASVAVHSEEASTSDRLIQNAVS